MIKIDKLAIDTRSCSNLIINFIDIDSSNIILPIDGRRVFNNLHLSKYNIWRLLTLLFMSNKFFNLRHLFKRSSFKLGLNRRSYFHIMHIYLNITIKDVKSPISSRSIFNNSHSIK